jgi:choline dehydrogenase
MEAGGGNDANDISAVPFFHPIVTEDPQVRWDYYVRHYADESLQRRDRKYYPDRGGVLYPRAGTLGGCTVHSALFEVYPSNSDWEYIAQLTGDPSWSPENMRKYFERLEQCRYVERPSPLYNNPTRHGFDGWLTSELADLKAFAQDSNLQRILTEVAREVNPEDPKRLLEAFFRGKLDPNDWRNNLRNKDGLYNIPQFMRNGRRRGSRDLIKETAAALPNNLIVQTHALVTRVLFDGTTAIGVEYLEGSHLYRADPNASQTESGTRHRILASREVILAAGAFNSPQILKLSGIGPADELRSHGIKPIVNLPGVGENLQDRYEIGVITQVKSDFTLTQNCSPGQMSDPCLSQWEKNGGIYTSNATIIGNLRKSGTAITNGHRDPDLFIFLAPKPFQGYYPGYSVPIAQVNNQFTWGILKAHTRNRAGNVKLRSADPRDTPVITFHYFSEGSDTKGEDLASVVDGVEFVRRINARLGDISQGEVLPGPTVRSRDDIASFVAAEAWGHHASCSNKMGPRKDPMAVVDGNFRVHGTRSLRVVDASVFPRIPGYFILTPIYMISEKASDVILASAQREAPRW